MVLASLAYAALIVYARGNQAGTLLILDGAKIGAIVGFLLWCTADFMFYSCQNVSNLTKTFVDPLLEIVHGGISGAVIAAVLKKVPASGSKPRETERRSSEKSNPPLTLGSQGLGIHSRALRISARPGRTGTGREEPGNEGLKEMNELEGFRDENST